MNTSEPMYAIIEWIGNKPILDGMFCFETKDDCLAYLKTIPQDDISEHTIIRIFKQPEAVGDKLILHNRCK